MIKTVFNIFFQDIIVATRNRFWLFTILVLIVSLLIIEFMPEDFDFRASFLIYDASKTPLTRTVIRFLETAEDSVVISEKELYEKVKHSRNKSGLIIRERDKTVEFSYLDNGLMDYRTVKEVLKQVYHQSLKHNGDPPKFSTATLRQESASVSQRENLIVLLIVMKDVLLGYLFAAAMIFQDKQEGFIRAYRISPAGLFGYIIGKSLVWVLFTVIYGLFFVVLSMGFLSEVTQWIRLILILAVSSMFFTLLGMATAVYFNSLSDWFVVGLIPIIINTIPELLFLSPQITSAWIKWIPSYPILFAVRDVLFYPDDGGDFYSFLIKMTVLMLFILPITALSVHKKLMKE